jgi:hypothetical protein
VSNEGSVYAALDKYRSHARAQGPDARRVISTPQDWESVRGRFTRSSDYRTFSASFEFNPASTLRLTGMEMGKALPRAKPGGPRWTIFEKAIVHEATVERVNELAQLVGRQTGGRPEPDADIFIALATGYATLAV